MGGSEKAIRKLFLRAQASAPCVLFFDEIDSLVPTRTSQSSDNGAMERVVNQLLTELDGITDRKGVFVLAATNRRERIDPALLRPGRFDQQLKVPLPTLECREKILQTTVSSIKQKSSQLVINVDLKQLAKDTEELSGADLAYLVHEAASLAVSDVIAPFISKDFENANQLDIEAPTNPEIQSEHFDRALRKIRESKPSSPNLESASGSSSGSKRDRNSDPKMEEPNLKRGKSINSN